MTTYSLSTSTGAIDLDALGLSGHGRDEGVLLRSVPTSRRGPEPIWNPAGLQDDAIRAAERVALSLLASTGVGQVVEIVKTLANGSSSTVALASATLAPRDMGYAIVESHGRGSRLAPIPAIVERDGVRGFSAVVEIAQTIARVLAAGDGDEDSIVAEIADARGSTSQAVRVLAHHGVAAARGAADRAREGREPAVAVLLPVS